MIALISFVMAAPNEHHFRVFVYKKQWKWLMIIIVPCFSAPVHLE